MSQHVTVAVNDLHIKKQTWMLSFGLDNNNLVPERGPSADFLAAASLLASGAGSLTFLVDSTVDDLHISVA